MHDLKVERFYIPRTRNGRWIHTEGPIKTFTLRGIKGCSATTRPG
jgi:hypothetical protein